ncbi:MAG: hypothetical protein LW860_00880 [Xanthomonadaceae bacterium]|jgi:hypothetical protein|nr:hypothetical protein [Xanthomonadaceae bacterium]
MKTVRILFWLVLLPTVLLVVGYRLNASLGGGRAQDLAQRADVERAREAREATARAEAESVQRRLDAQATLARECLALADRATGGALRDADPLLVLVAGGGCGPTCDLDATASALADEWRFYSLNVLLLRTREGGPAASPLGVTTLVLPQCAGLASGHGDDYFLRLRDGSLSSGGERYAQALRAAPDSGPPPFAPDALLKAHYDAR